jgi:hypothetical protein
MAQTATNIRSGPGALYYAANGTATPNLEDVTGAVLTEANWTTATYSLLPFTTQGVKIDFETKVFQHKVNEALAVVGGTVEEATGKFTVTLAEADVDAFTLALHAMTKTTVAAGADQAGLTKTVYDGTNDVTFLTFGHLSTLNAKSFLHMGWKVAANGGFSAAYKKGEMTVVDVVFDMYEDPAASPAEQRMYSIREYTAVPVS